MAGLSLKDRVRITAIQEGLRVGCGCGRGWMDGRMDVQTMVNGNLIVPKRKLICGMSPHQSKQKQTQKMGWVDGY